MDLTRLAVQLVVAVVCAGVASILVPRRIPGKIWGLFFIGLLGVWVGEWGFALLRQQFNLNVQFLTWQVEGVLIIPAIVGSAIVLYLLTLFMRWGRYST
ncbi:MAG TPA: hypothetical protein IGS37_04890 [Synechococcales cyanobacterium M55_K2018_004]|nr:hypothetical protein [Synechococcales cyanobacterium M55_K2018_004]